MAADDARDPTRPARQILEVGAVAAQRDHPQGVSRLVRLERRDPREVGPRAREVPGEPQGVRPRLVRRSHVGMHTQGLTELGERPGQVVLERPGFASHDVGLGRARPLVQGGVTVAEGSVQVAHDQSQPTANDASSPPREPPEVLACLSARRAPTRARRGRAR
ncbi:MAG: hypothetical protein M9894_01020 [Planctomycetes bacterium]|nr:hypothetical protein [Planctomycetota bacterium]